MAMGSPAPVAQAVPAVGLVAAYQLVGGLAANPEPPAQIRYGPCPCGLELNEPHSLRFGARLFPGQHISS